jgi:hypothetical protein
MPFKNSISGFRPLDQFFVLKYFLFSFTFPGHIFSRFLLFLGQSSAKSSSEVTLNALNASESEADVEGLADFGNGEVR